MSEEKKKILKREDMNGELKSLHQSVLSLVAMQFLIEDENQKKVSEYSIENKNNREEDLKKEFIDKLNKFKENNSNSTITNNFN